MLLRTEAQKTIRLPSCSPVLEAQRPLADFCKMLAGHSVLHLSRGGPSQGPRPTPPPPSNNIAASHCPFGVCPSQQTGSSLKAGWSISFSSFFFFLVFFGPHPQPMEVPRLGVEPELQLPAYLTATATRIPSCICGLHHSSQQRQILNPRSKARDQTRILMDPSQIHFCCAPRATPHLVYFSRTPKGPHDA